MKPSEILAAKPSLMASVFQKSEHETVFRSALIISERTGDNWGLTKDVYEAERIKDGHYSTLESEIADQVLPYLESVDTAALYSSELKNLLCN